MLAFIDYNLLSIYFSIEHIFKTYCVLGVLQDSNDSLGLEFRLAVVIEYVDL